MLRDDLRSAALTVAVLVLFVFVLGLARLLRLVLAGLVALLAVLARLPPLLALSRLTSLLVLLLHIVCHKRFLLRRRGPSCAFEICCIQNLVATGDWKGWDGFLRHSP